METEEKKITVGKEAADRLANQDPTQTVIDTEREIHKNYYDQINECVNNHKHWTSPYYITVLTKKERLLPNTLRHYFIGRQTLPSPDWDQTVWRYYPSSGKLQYLWTIPDKEAAHMMMWEPHLVPPENRTLLSFVQAMFSNNLYRQFYDKFEKGKEKDVRDTEYVDNNQIIVPETAPRKPRGEQ